MAEDTRRDISHADLQYSLGRLEGKVDALLAQQSEDAGALKEVSKRLQSLEVEFATAKAERTTTSRNASALWSFIAAAAALVISAWQALADRITN